MEYLFRIVHPWLLLFMLSIIVLAGYFVWFFSARTLYRYPLIAAVKRQGYRASALYKILPFLSRLLALVGLAFLIARPQWIDLKSKVTIEGIDIMLVLDASGSMQCFDDLQDQRSRFEVAKQEAMTFIDKRNNDQIGLILFAKDAVSRCPRTNDKKLLKQILADTYLGTLNPNGTSLSLAVAMAARRLKDSAAKSKILILLTDGEPTPETDINPLDALEIVKKLGIKMYTVGVGGEHGGLLKQEPFGIVAMNFKYNKDLLKMFALESGGKFFEARNPSDMHAIYQTIDSLEKTDYQADMFTRYLDIILPLILLIVGALLVELFVSLIWFVV